MKKTYLFIYCVLMLPSMAFALPSLTIINDIQTPHSFRIINPVHNWNEDEIFVIPQYDLPRASYKVEGTTYYLSFQCSYSGSPPSGNIVVVFDVIKGVQQTFGSCILGGISATPQWDGNPQSDIHISKF